MTHDTIVMIMAGGKGSRLAPLTSHRAKPAVPFAGRYRIIDFVLSNFVNSGYRRIYVLSQYMASSMIHHLSRTWRLSGIDEFVETVPAQMRRGEHWYLGTADSIYQNLNLVTDSRARHVAVFGGDHIYKFDVSAMDHLHRETAADLTVAAMPVPRAEASRFGVIEVDEDGCMVGFEEKPADPKPIPGQPDRSLVSMGNYFFRTDVLEEALVEDARRRGSRRDFGKDVIPRLLESGHKIMVYDFGANQVPGELDQAEPYWRDVGTIDSYVAATMDVRSRLPILNLYNRDWRIRTAQRDFPPARFVHDAEGRSANLIDSLICEGCIISNATVINSLVSYDCFVHADSHIEHSILFAGANIGAGARLRNVLADKNCSVDPGAALGFDEVADRARFPFVSEGGVIVLPKGTHVPARGPIRIARDIAALLRQDPATRDAMERHAAEYVLDGRCSPSVQTTSARFARFTR